VSAVVVVNGSSLSMKSKGHAMPLLAGGDCR
jgi:hypothetical protein